MNCNKCNKEFKDEDTVYAISVVESVYPDVGSGGVEEWNLCEDCYFIYFNL